MAQRFNIYGNVHKGLRRTLCSLLADAGSADLGSRELAAVGGRWLAVQALLCAHHTHEDRFIGPHLQRSAPLLFAELEQEHHALDLQVTALGLAARALTNSPAKHAEPAQRFYLQLASFVGRYLLHMAAEEGAYLAALHEAYSDAELMAIEGELVASIAPDVMAAFMSAMLPAMSPSERFELLSGMRMHAPAAFAGTRQLAEQVLTPLAWQELEASLFASEATAGSVHA